MRGWITGVLLAAGVALAGCSSAATAANGADAATPVAAMTATAPNEPQRITLTVANAMAFTPAAIRVHAGQPVELTLKNDGQMRHDFSLTAAGGQTASRTFTLDQPGTFTFECSQPGHASAGMHGTITAQ
jgi:uncharacterized cupredoxin-like copper-binding protein